MSRTRFDPNAPAERTERVGDVYAAVVADTVQKESLGVIYRKLFEAEGIPRDFAPHVYAKPSRARCEIRDVAAWIFARFGNPGAGVPTQTPFGYLNGLRWPGWIVYFAVLARGNSFGLQRDFMTGAALLRWAGGGSASRAPLRLAAVSSIPRESSEAAVAEETPASPEPSEMTEAVEKPEPSSTPEAGVRSRDTDAAALDVAARKPRESPPRAASAGGGYEERTRGYTQGSLTVDDIAAGRRARDAAAPAPPAASSDEALSPEEEEDIRLWMESQSPRGAKRMRQQAIIQKYGVSGAIEIGASQERVFQRTVERAKVEQQLARERREAAEREAEEARVAELAAQRAADEARAQRSVTTLDVTSVPISRDVPAAASAEASADKRAGKRTRATPTQQ